jgi:hypothetical protein
VIAEDDTGGRKGLEDGRIGDRLKNDVIAVRADTLVAGNLILTVAPERLRTKTWPATVTPGMRLVAEE